MKASDTKNGLMHNYQQEQKWLVSDCKVSTFLRGGERIVLTKTRQEMNTTFENCKNQSSICGKGVGLGLFPSDSLESQSCDFDAFAHIGP